MLGNNTYRQWPKLETAVDELAPPMTTSSSGPKENDEVEEDGCHRTVPGATVAALELGPGKNGRVTNLLDCFTNLPNSHGCRAGVSAAKDVMTAGRKRRLRRRRFMDIVVIVYPV